MLISLMLAGMVGCDGDGSGIVEPIPQDEAGYATMTLAAKELSILRAERVGYKLPEPEHDLPTLWAGHA